MYVVTNRLHPCILFDVTKPRCTSRQRVHNKSAAIKCIKWTDGAPQQFKWCRPLWFLSMLMAISDGCFSQLWWFFFASCHGKGEL